MASWISDAAVVRPMWICLESAVCTRVFDLVLWRLDCCDGVLRELGVDAMALWDLVGFEGEWLQLLERLQLRFVRTSVGGAFYQI